MTDDEALEEKMGRFYAHLADCRQCDENPFDLCETGAAILNGGCYLCGEEDDGRCYCRYDAEPKR